jgi:hypothetical protein
MPLIEVNWNPDKRELRRFGWIALAASLAVAAMFHWVRGLDLRWCGLIVAAGGVTAISPFVSMGITRWIYWVLVGATLPIGLVISLVLMALFYYGLITPIGLVFRLIGRDILNRRFDPGAKTYWQGHRSPSGPERYFQQF